MRLEHVLIATDMSAAATDAARWTARHFAPDAAITLLHVVEPPRVPSFLEGLVPGGRESEARMREEASRELSVAAEALEVEHVRTDLRTGDPPATIAYAARTLDADLVVAGAHGGGRGRPGILGSTAERLVGASRVPVLVAAHLPAGPPRHLLAAVDESVFTLPVLRWAGFLARRFGTGLTALHATQPMLRGPVTFAPSAYSPEPFEVEVNRRSRDWLERALGEAGLEPGAAEVRIQPGQAAFVIPEEAERSGADLIVIGSRGAGTVRRFLIGSTASLVLRSSTCPVLVVPPES